MERRLGLVEVVAQLRRGSADKRGAMLEEHTTRGIVILDKSRCSEAPEHLIHSPEWVVGRGDRRSPVGDKCHTYSRAECYVGIRYSCAE